MSKPVPRMVGCIVAVLVAVLPAAGQAPMLNCVTPPAPNNPSERCTLRVPPEAREHEVVVQLMGVDTVPKESVTFTVQLPGGRSITQKRPFDTERKSRFTWFGAPAADVKVTATAPVAGRTLTREIDVRPAPAATQRELTLVSPPVVYGYEKRQLREPVKVRIHNPGDRCESNTVVFRPYGAVGSGSPDSVRALTDPVHGGCTASTYWRLGEGVGHQHLRATLSDEAAKSLTLNAVARALPRINPGAVSTYDFREYKTVNVSERKIQVTRRVVSSTGDTAVIVVDSVTRNVSVGEVDGNWFTKPVISVDFPILARLTGLRASLGAAFQSADRDWYLGMSAIQPFRGVSQEAVGADFHAVFHFGRRQVLANSGCIDDGNNSDCRSKEKFFFPLGLGMMATFDSGSLFSALGSIIK